MNHSPMFPVFQPLLLQEKKVIEEKTQAFLPYSDYNFTSLWSYNTEDDVVYSMLHGNLVLRFRDYVTNQPFYTFLGITNMEETITTLFKQAEKEKLLPVLKLIGEELVDKIEQRSELIIEEDRDNFDYILNTKQIVDLEGSHFQKKRYRVKKFHTDYSTAKTVVLNTVDDTLKKSMLELFETWKENKHASTKEVEHELLAINRLLKDISQFNLVIVTIIFESKLIGFSITEVLSSGYGIFHFVKCNKRYNGIFETIYNTTAKVLQDKDCIFLNREQDLGIEKLREAKLSWNPVEFLKKYTVRRIT